MIGMIAGILFWLVCVPFFSGLLPTRFWPKERQSFGLIFCNGYLTQIALFEIIYIIFVLLGSDSARWLGVVYAIFSVLYAFLSGWFGRESLKQGKLILINEKWSVFTVLFLLSVLGQMVLRFLQRVSDGDDAHFVATVTLTSQSVLMNTIQPYTGNYTPVLDLRHVFSGMPVYMGMLSRFTGVHASVLTHCCMACIILILHYCLIYETAKVLFERHPEGAGLFACMASLINIFGYVSLYTPQTFLLTRTWQGKTILANIALPFVFLLLLEMYRCKEKKAKVGWSVLVFLTACVFALACASTGVVLMAVVTFVYIAFLFVPVSDRKKYQQET